jgi:hypothetical protein
MSKESSSVRHSARRAATVREPRTCSPADSLGGPPAFQAAPLDDAAQAEADLGGGSGLATTREARSTQRTSAHARESDEASPRTKRQRVASGHKRKFKNVLNASEHENFSGG